MTEPNKALIREWVDTLRSGRYEQGYGRLIAIHEDGKKYCCLGVACDLFASQIGGMSLATEPAKSADRNIEEIRFTWNTESVFGSTTEVFPEPLAQALGIDRNPTIWMEDGEMFSLAELNDSRTYPFSEIADLIEKKYLGEELDNG